MINSILVIVCFIFLTSCDYLRVVTAINHRNRIQSKDTVLKYMERGKIMNYPVYCLDTSFYYTDLWWPYDGMFNKSGTYLKLDPPTTPKDNVTCSAEDFRHIGLTDILQNGDYYYRSDSLKLEFTFFNSSGIPYQKTREFAMNLEQLSTFLRTLDGDSINIYSTYDDYIVFKQFNLSGKSKLNRIVIREQIEDIQKLNQVYGNKIEVALLCLDRLDWMYQTSENSRDQE